MGKNEDLVTQAAIEEMTVPTTPFDRNPPDPVLETFKNAPISEHVPSREENERFEKAWQAYEEGRFVSLEVLMRATDGEIPDLQVVSQGTPE